MTWDWTLAAACFTLGGGVAMTHLDLLGFQMIGYLVLGVSPGLIVKAARE